MSQSRFVLKQIHVKGSGNSDLTRYVSKSKLDEERKGKKPRLLFSEHDDRLTQSEAKKFLSITGGDLRKDEILHYVLSFRDEKDFELLGTDEEERRKEVSSILRDSICKALDSIGASEMRWVAGIHRNTDNPHIHILFNKNTIERATGEVIKIKRLPSSLIAHHEAQSDGSRVFSYGEIINTFVQKIAAKEHERTRLLQQEIAIPSHEILDRETLSRELMRGIDREIPRSSVNHSHEQKEHTINQSKEQVKDDMKEKTHTDSVHVHLL